MNPVQFLQERNIDLDTVVFAGNEDDDNRDGFDLGELLDEYGKIKKKEAKHPYTVFLHELVQKVDEEDDITNIGEWIMNRFDLWK